MPPPVNELSDDESTGSSIPYNDNEDNNDVAEDSKDDAEEEGDQEDVFTVEKIIGHSFLPNGNLLLRVQWEGYPDPADQTLEPEENLLEGANDIVREYFESIGGRPKKPQPKKRKSMGKAKATEETPEPKRRRKSRASSETTTPAKRDRKEQKEEVNNETQEEQRSEDDEINDVNNLPDWVPKTKSWENQVKSVDTILREGDSLIAFLNWKNNKKSKVSIETAYEKCPRKMLQFYEQHLVFKDA